MAHHLNNSSLFLQYVLHGYKTVEAKLFDVFIQPFFSNNATLFQVSVSESAPFALLIFRSSGLHRQSFYQVYTILIGPVIFGLHWPISRVVAI